MELTRFLILLKALIPVCLWIGNTREKKKNNQNTQVNLIDFKMKNLIRFSENKASS